MAVLTIQLFVLISSSPQLLHTLFKCNLTPKGLNYKEFCKSRKKNPNKNQVLLVIETICYS